MLTGVDRVVLWNSDIERCPSRVVTHRTFGIPRAQNQVLLVASLFFASVLRRRVARPQHLRRLRRRTRRAAEAPEAPEAPGAVPGFGHLPLIGLGALGLQQQQPHERMDELQNDWAEKGMLRLQFGASEVFLLSSPEAVEEALCGKNLQASAGRPSLPSVRSNGLSQGLSSSQPDQDWQLMRRVLLREAFATSRVAAAGPVIDAEANALVAQLTERLGKPVAVRPVLRRSFTRLLLRWALSLEGEEVMKLETLVEEAWAILTDPVVTATDFLGSVSLPGVLDGLPRIRRERTRLLRSVLARRRSQNSGKGDFLDALLEAQKKHGFGDDLIIETLVSLTTAGISTVATALEWLLLLLAQDRSAQERARKDGDFLDACILEALRLKMPLFIPRRCLEDIQVAGYKVKANSLLLPDSYKLAHDDTLWDSPNDFRPERFLGKERPFLTFKPGTQLPRCPFNTPSEAAKFLPFGLGARFCPGAPLAMQQLRSFMEKLLETLQWSGKSTKL